MSNHSASYMLNEILEELIEKDYLDRFSEDEKEEIIRIFGRKLSFRDGNFSEMIAGLEKYFGICHACQEKVGAENLVDGTCPECR